MLDFLAGGDFAAQIRNFSIAFFPAFLGIILHEVGHGYAAMRLGDPTARLYGRLTLNPLPHVDPMGLVCFVLTGLSGGFVFGWAKPVPVDVRNLRRPLRDMMLVALAGPGVNVTLAILFAMALKVTLMAFPPYIWQSSATYIFFLSMMQAGISINLGLAFLNMLPIPPLDGSKVLAYFLPQRSRYSYLSIERYGFLILMALLFTGLLSKILGPLLRASFELLLTVLGII